MHTNTIKSAVALRTAMLGIAITAAAVLFAFALPVRAEIRLPKLISRFAPLVKADEGESLMAPAPMPVEGEGEELFEEPEQPTCDYFQVKENTRNVLRDIKQQVRDLNRMEKQAKKLKNMETLQQGVAETKATLQSTQALLQSLAKDIKQNCETLQDATQEYWDAQYWEMINDMRRRIELPRELGFIAKDLKRLNKMLAGKTFRKILEPMGVNWEQLQNNVATLQAAHTTAMAAVESGDLETAESEMEPFRDGGMHPGEIQGVMHSLREFGDRTRFVKDESVKAALQELWAPVVEAFNAGDYREARESIDAARQEFYEIIPLLEKLQGRTRGREESAVFGRLNKLEGLLRSKLEGNGELEEVEEPVNGGVPEGGEQGIIIING